MRQKDRDVVATNDNDDDDDDDDDDGDDDEHSDDDDEVVATNEAAYEQTFEKLHLPFNCEETKILHLNAVLFPSCIVTCCEEF